MVFRPEKSTPVWTNYILHPLWASIWVVEQEGRIGSGDEEINSRMIEHLKNSSSHWIEKQRVVKGRGPWESAKAPKRSNRLAAQTGQKHVNTFNVPEAFSTFEVHQQLTILHYYTKLLRSPEPYLPSLGFCKLLKRHNQLLLALLRSVFAWKPTAATPAPTIWTAGL